VRVVLVYALVALVCVCVFVALVCVLVVLVCVLVASVLGHGVMVLPTPLNTNPTTSDPCGVAALPTNPTASTTWATGKAVTVGWHLIASDGGTNVAGYFDPTATGARDSDFSVKAFDDLATTNGLIFYNKTFTVPATLTCTSASGLCLFRMVSNQNNWNSCTYVNITNCQNCPPPPPAPPVCKTAGALKFCYEKANDGVYVDANADPSELDLSVKQVFWQNVNKTTVFADGTSQACHDDYRAFLCASDLPPCPGSGQTVGVGSACQSMCQKAMASCQLTEAHTALYDCNSLPKCPDQTSSASSLALPLAVAAVAGVAALAF